MNNQNSFNFLNHINLNTGLVTLDLTGLLLGENTLQQMRRLKIFLITDTRVQKLILRGNNLGSNSENIKLLCEGLSKNKTIQVLDLSNNNLGINKQDLGNGLVGLTMDNEMQRINKIFELLCDCITDCLSLRELNLDDNLYMDKLWMTQVKRTLNTKNIKTFNKKVEDQMISSENNEHWEKIWNCKANFESQTVKFYNDPISFMDEPTSE